MTIEIEKPKNYQKENLPDFITKEGSEFWVVVGQERKGPFDLVMDFGLSRDWMRTKVRWELEVHQNKGNNFVFLAFDNPLVKREMRAITDLVNNGKRNFRNPVDRGEYRKHLIMVYQYLAEEVQRKIGPEDALIFAPKPAGILIEEIYRKLGFSKDDFFDYQMSRIQKDDGGLLVGIKLGKNNPKIENYQTIVFTDDCLASDVNAWATLELIKEGRPKNKISLLNVYAIIAVTAASQKGFENLTSQATLNYFGFGTIEAVAAIPVYHWMTKNFYLQHPDGRYVVGDMGEWTKP